jgi:hypothetical protein
MRKFVLVLVLALALPAAALARPGDKGDGTLVVKNSRGQLALNASGSALGKLDDGSIVVADTSTGAGDDIQVLGTVQPPKVTVDKVTGATTYTGQKLRFRIVGGGYQLTITGKGINVTAVGKGAVWGSDLSGQYSADNGAFRTLTGGVLPFNASFGQS